MKKYKIYQTKAAYTLVDVPKAINKRIIKIKTSTRIPRRHLYEEALNIGVLAIEARYKNF